MCKLHIRNFSTYSYAKRTFLLNFTLLDEEAVAPGGESFALGAPVAGDCSAGEQALGVAT
jgi:hypothetical protein